MNQRVPLSSSSRLLALVAAAGERAGMRFLEFFAANIRKPEHTSGLTTARPWNFWPAARAQASRRLPPAPNREPCLDANNSMLADAMR
jgi:hypothetical protein